MLKFQQPMLFVGLGGTGCEVGAQLERRFREEICGPDGTRLAAGSGGTRTYLPYELPSFLQFVYADLDGPDLAEKRRTAVPGGGHEIAVRRTAHVMTDLVPPKLSNSREVSESLRNRLDSSVLDWLPPIETDPRRGPLNHGAGQFPTVARAVLFETLRQNPDAAKGAITRAIDAINTSGVELSSFGARLDRSCSVFVVFSVAGGTGSGIFYDYLHLVGKAMSDRQLRPKIYPLVLLPSAFPVGSGGGRAAELNAGSSLIDLFRLIDSLVSRNQGRQIGPRGRSASTEVRHPDGPVPLEANRIETAYLFGHRSGAARKQDLHRSMVEMMLTLTGAVPKGPDDAQRSDDAVQIRYESSAINRVDIADRSQTGVGRRTVATSAVASMTVPVDELLDIVSSRLLAEGVRHLDVAPAAELNDSEIEAFFTASGLGNLLYRPAQELPPPERIDGYDVIVRMLGERARAMTDIVDSLRNRLGEEASRMAGDFLPQAAASVLLGRMDIFRLSRIVNGVSTAGSERTRQGVDGMLASRRTSSGGPDEPHAGCPSGAGLPKPSLRRLRFDDETVQAILADQDDWYRRRTRQRWHLAWDEAHRLWDETWNQFRRELAQVVQSLRDHVGTEEKRRPGRVAALYSPRVGVAYLLPPGDNRLDEFYQDVRDEFAATFRADPSFPANPNVGAILSRVLRGDGWPQVLAEARRGPRLEPQRAVEQARELIKGRIDDLNNHPDREPLLPRLNQLLVRAAGGTAKVRDTDLAQFRNKLAGLVPGDFAPPGDGKLHMIVSYPAASDDRGLEDFLQAEIRIAADRVPTVEFRHIDAESLSVVLMRTSMGITEVPEVRHAVRTWSDAVRQQQASDRLRWRRRLAPDPGYLLIALEDRVQVLHRLLCAVWNGQVKTEGPDPDNPLAIVIDTSEGGAAMKLELHRFAGLSSWGSVLRAYERWIVANDDRQAFDLTDRLMNLEPHGLREGDAMPSALFTTLAGIAPGELKAVRAERQLPGRDQSPLLRMLEDFWHVRSTDPAAQDGDRVALFHDALQLPFVESDDAVAHSLQQLFEATCPGAPR